MYSSFNWSLKPEQTLRCQGPLQEIGWLLVTCSLVLHWHSDFYISSCESSWETSHFILPAYFSFGFSQAKHRRSDDSLPLPTVLALLSLCLSLFSSVDCRSITSYTDSSSQFSIFPVYEINKLEILLILFGCASSPYASSARLRRDSFGIYADSP